MWHGLPARVPRLTHNARKPAPGGGTFKPAPKKRGTASPGHLPLRLLEDNLARISGRLAEGCFPPPLRPA